MYSEYIKIKGGTENIMVTFKYQNNKKDKIKEGSRLYESTLLEEIQTEVQMYLLQKRCGDRLQVLSCLDKNRKYNINGLMQNLRDSVQQTKLL